jgi:hypothetical protein
MSFALSRGDVLVKHIPVIVLSGLGQASQAKLLKKNAAAFATKLETWFENDPSLLDSDSGKRGN